MFQEPRSIIYFADIPIDVKEMCDACPAAYPMAYCSHGKERRHSPTAPRKRRVT